MDENANTAKQNALKHRDQFVNSRSGITHSEGYEP